MTGSNRLQGEEVSGYDVLDAREQRAARQRDWLRLQEDCCLVSVTLNIAGSVKRTPLIRDGFRAGIELVDDTLTNLANQIFQTVEKED